MPGEDPPDTYVCYQDRRRIPLELTFALFGQLDGRTEIDEANLRFADTLNTSFGARIPCGCLALVYFKGKSYSKESATCPTMPSRRPLPERPRRGNRRPSFGLHSNFRKMKREITADLDAVIGRAETQAWKDLKILDVEKHEYSIHLRPCREQEERKLVGVSMASQLGYSSNSVDSLVQHIFCTKAHKMREIRGQKWIAIAPGWFEAGFKALRPAIRENAALTGFSHVLVRWPDGSVSEEF
jgi:hypothetical protein